MNTLKYTLRGITWTVLTVFVGAVAYVGYVIVACW